MFYAGGEPWHELGQRLDHPATAEEAMGLITRRYDALEQTFHSLARVALDDNALARYVGKVFPGPADHDDERAWGRVDARRYWTSWLFRNGKGNEEPGVAGTQAGAVGPASPERRLESC